MAFLGTNSLTALLTGNGIICPFEPTRIKNGSYELSLGSQVFQTDSAPRTVKNLTDNEKIEIRPGQFALLLTKEYVRVPNDIIAFISIKAGIKFKGLVNVSGFHVDPGYSGKLLFSVYNAGPSSIVLSSGTSYFPIWFTELNEAQEYIGNHKNQNEIPDSAIEALVQGELASPNVLSKRIDEVKHLKTKIEWVVIAILGLLIAITAKIYTDKNDLKEAVEFGYRNKEISIFNDSINSIKHIHYLEQHLDSLENEVKKFGVLHKTK